MAGKRAPEGLSKDAGAFWRHTVAEFDFEPHHERLLTLACEAWDRGRDAGEAVARDGAFYVDRHGATRPHPGLAVQRDATMTFARLLRELDLDGEPGPDPRPPRRV